MWVEFTAVADCCKKVGAVVVLDRPLYCECWVEPLVVEFMARLCVCSGYLYDHPAGDKEVGGGGANACLMRRAHVVMLIKWFVNDF